MMISIFCTIKVSIKTRLKLKMFIILCLFYTVFVIQSGLLLLYLSDKHLPYNVIGAKKIFLMAYYT